ncbi:uncharacterized protein MPTK1_7g00810 [Marchantia polymorpha subsp. ruderalis]|uniref:Xaa-Pro dipeptidyl-peptidase-like domain-containing protein n=2 Tax=Marchantia polymorpha TaxID=3197 RepID=A0A176VGQ5_MARPO|nr:hypothetical protein AXG93_2062s1060 [Marchantia polymorpha subsp. ruderalis]PTQ39221.1 hypothetical protein MARPO_0046s0043 [Marchantia polymorpha]BBN15785.1 hypothetical protein Mp_7g00810 [Marchantia polymorpha subsp. ruderalis]|eukprot:PTQ39221.1 hypothetical protein MARPO_0046s0043 [Marchantia polymorpha]
MGEVEFATVDEGNGVQLSVRLYKPGEDVKEKKNATLILVHQYTVLGGCQGLMKGMANLLAAKGFVVLTFDQRGAGRSTGRSTFTGSAEVNDVVAVSRWAVDNIPTSSIVLVGSSAGAPIAGSAVDCVEEIKGYVGLGYPFGFLASVLFGRHYKTVLQSPKPKLFVMGTRDGFTSVKQLEGKLKTAAGRAEKRLVVGAGHFEMEGPRYDDEMVGYVVEFADSLDESS